MFFYQEFLLHCNKRIHASHLANTTRNSLFKIDSKRRLIGYRIQRLHPIAEVRPQLTRIISQTPKTINIHYGHKVSTKKMKRSFKSVDEKREVRQNAEQLHSFNQRVVIAKGRYLKPVTNQKKTCYHPNFHTLVL